MKYLSSAVKKQVPPFYMLISRGAGFGKSHLIKVIHMALNKLLLYKSRDPDKPRILLLTPTGVAAINIGDTTIYTVLGIGIGSKLVPLGEKQKVKLRVKLSNTKLIIIDEISMVSSELCENNKPFVGIPKILCGDLYQLPPVRGKPIYMSNQSVKGYITLDLWKIFQFVELTEVMRQKGENLLIHILNKIRVANISKSVDAILKEQSMSQNHSSFPTDALHFFAEKKPLIDHNESMLNKLQSTSLSIKAID